jgi:hypothetical protein
VRYVFLKVLDGREVALGAVSRSEDVPELLRHVAEYYQANPDDCAALLAELRPAVRPVSDPFAAPRMSVSCGPGWQWGTD